MVVHFPSDLESQRDGTQHPGLPEAVTPRLGGPIATVPGWEEPWLSPSMPSCPVPSPVCMRISSACRSSACQLVGGTTASAGGQHRHVPLLCKGQPSCHPVQVSFAAVETAWSKASPPHACHVACHTRPRDVLRSRCPNRLLRPSPHSGPTYEPSRPSVSFKLPCTLPLPGNQGCLSCFNGLLIPCF